MRQLPFLVALWVRRVIGTAAYNHLLSETATGAALRVRELERELARARRRLARIRSHVRAAPSILFVSIPKSGTVFTREMLARGVGLEVASLATGSFPRYAINLQALERFRHGGMVAAEHCDASPENLQLLGAFLERWVVHVRDPRSVLLSWVHHLNRLYAEQDSAPHELLYVCPTPPDEYFGYPFRQQIDWNIDHFLPNVLGWTRAWIEAHDSGRYNMLLTTFSDVLAGEDAFIAKILAFYGIPPALFHKPYLEKSIRASHFRVGRADEWRECFTASQLARTTRMIGDDLLLRFGWPGHEGDGRGGPRRSSGPGFGAVHVAVGEAAI